MNIQNRKWKPARFVIAIIGLFLTSQAIFAKDMQSLGIEFGAIGSEKRLSQTSTISESKVSLPYTQTLFNPDLRVRVDFPAADIKENCFLNINLDYDLTWNGYSSSDINLFINETIITHLFSFCPELVFEKEDFRFFFGTGGTFGVSSNEYEIKTNSSISNQELTIYYFIWNFELGTKYFLSEHIAVLADFTISVPLIKLERNGSYSIKQSNKNSSEDYADTNTNGQASLHFSPKVGICYTF